MKGKRDGFTLIEAILASVIIGVGLVGIMTLFQRTVSTAFTTDQSIQATHLARERLERIVFDKKMKGYDFVVAANYPASETFTGSFAPFTRTLAIQEVDSNNLANPQSNTGYKTVTVTVTWGQNNLVQLKTLVTKWNE